MNLTSDAIGGVAGLVLFLAGLVLALVWLVFPFLVIGHLDRLIHAVEQQTALLRQLLKPEAGATPSAYPLLAAQPRSKAPWVILVLVLALAGLAGWWWLSK